MVAQSILMPLYNGVEFLAEAVTSVLQQTCPEWELLIAINGYEANSNHYQLVYNYIQKLGDARIKVLDYHMCKGKAATLNKMLHTCQYDYVAILDVDDVWLPPKLATQQPYLQQDYDVIGTKCVYFGDLNGIIPDIPTGDISTFNFLHVNPIINSSIVMKKELAAWDETTMLEDYDLWLRLWKTHHRFYNCPEVVVKHRIHQTSAFNSKGNHNSVADLRAKYSN